MKRILLIALLVGVVSPAWGEVDYFISGTALLISCQAPKGSIDRVACSGYIMGFYDALGDADTERGMGRGFGDVKFCRPKGATPDQMADIVKKYLEDNPQVRHEGVPAYIAVALYKAWPCPK